MITKILTLDIYLTETAKITKTEQLTNKSLTPTETRKLAEEIHDEYQKIITETAPIYDEAFKTAPWKEFKKLNDKMKHYCEIESICFKLMFTKRRSQKTYKILERAIKEAKEAGVELL